MPTFEVIELLRRVGIPSPEVRMLDYPHKMSGGMRQRVMVAMAIACNPRLIIADEPTTALDVTIQAQILSLLDDLRHTHGMSILLITHDLGVIAEMAEQVLVMYTGRVVDMRRKRAFRKSSPSLHPGAYAVDAQPRDRGYQGQAQTDPRSSSQFAGAAARVQIQYKVSLVFRPLLSRGTGFQPPAGGHPVRCWLY